MGRGKKKKQTKQVIGAEEYKNAKGELHREGGPATFGEFGEAKYYKNGLLHRENGPAVYWTDGEFSMEHYYREGQLHREDGPAVYSTAYHPVGRRVEIRYFLLGQELDYKEWEQWSLEKDQNSYFFLERIGKLVEKQDKIRSGLFQRTLALLSKSLG